jgi:hypothetical protein
VGYRQVPKEALQVLVPLPVKRAVQRKRKRDKQSLSAAATELLCRALALDPAEFGLSQPDVRQS